MINPDSDLTADTTVKMAAGIFVKDMSSVKEKEREDIWDIKIDI